MTNVGWSKTLDSEKLETVTQRKTMYRLKVSLLATFGWVLRNENVIFTDSLFDTDRPVHKYINTKIKSLLCWETFMFLLLSGICLELAGFFFFLADKGWTWASSTFTFQACGLRLLATGNFCTQTHKKKALHLEQPHQIDLRGYLSSAAVLCQKYKIKNIHRHSGQSETVFFFPNPNLLPREKPSTPMQQNETRWQRFKQIQFLKLPLV